MDNSFSPQLKQRLQEVKDEIAFLLYDFPEFEKEWHESQHPLSSTELVQAFPEAMGYVKKKLKALQCLYEKEEKERKEILDRVLVIVYASENIRDKDFACEFWKDVIYDLDLDSIQKKMKPLQNLLSIYYWIKNPPANPESGITELDIQRAKEFPITNLAKPNRAGFILCPFHEEKTPSCKIYPSNHWYCFGCNSGGDVIDFVGKLNNLSFHEAVRKLLT